MPNRSTPAELAERVRGIEAKLDRMPDLTDAEREALHDMARTYIGLKALRGVLMFAGSVLGLLGSVVMNWPRIKAALISWLT